MRILIAASGSGGHLFPAKFIMEEFLAAGDTLCFVGSGRELEKTILGPLEVPMEVIDIVGLKNKGFFGLLKFLVKAPGALLETRNIIKKFQPDAVLGVGGYASVFPVFIASLMGIPTWIHEAELHLGLANRALSYFANKVSVTSERGEFPIPARKIVYTGHPVRRDIAQAAIWEGENIPSRLLILGGSQGSRSLDLAVFQLMPFFASQKIEVFHQCRAESLHELRKAYEEHRITAKVETFVHELTSLYAWTHVVLSRSGAGTVTEIALIGKPSVFVPYPYAQGNHQYYNAKTLVDAGKAMLVEEGEGFPEALKSALEKIFEPQLFHAMRERSQMSRVTNGAKKIADGVRSLLK